MIRAISFVLFIGFALPACSEQPEPPRRCYESGWMTGEACDYTLSELSQLQGAEVFPARFYAYLQGSDGRLTLSEGSGGQGATIRVGVVDAKDHDAPIDWMAGHKVHVHGIYHPAKQTIDVKAISWVEEDDVPSPVPPGRGRNTN